MRIAAVVSVIAAASAFGVAQGRDSALLLTRGAQDRDISAPTKPTQLRLARSARTNLTLKWRRSNDKAGVTGYKVFVAGGRTFRTRQTTYTISALACRTTYSDEQDLCVNRRMRNFASRAFASRAFAASAHALASLTGATAFRSI